MIKFTHVKIFIIITLSFFNTGVQSSNHRIDSDFYSLFRFSNDLNFRRKSFIKINNARSNKYDRVVKYFRGGFLQTMQKSDVPVEESQNNFKIIRNIRRRRSYFSILIFMTLVFCYRDVISVGVSSAIASTRASFDMEKFRANLLRTLRDANELGFKGLSLYLLGLAVWECFGLTTSFVETLAGMAFDLEKAIFFSFAGKFLGALLAFIVGRLFLAEKVKDFTKENEIFSLIKGSIEKNPISMAFTMRFFPFPELMKNLALSVMPLSIMSFGLATLMNQLPFSILWCMVGAEASKALDPSFSPPSKFLSFCVAGVAIFGIAGSPLILAIYMNSLRSEA